MKMRDDLDDLIDETARALTEGTPSSSIRERVAARVGQPRPWWPSYAWRLAAVAAVVVLAVWWWPAQVERPVAPPPVPSQPVAAALSPDNRPQAVAVEERAPNVAARPVEEVVSTVVVADVEPLTLEPLDVEPLELQTLNMPTLEVPSLELEALTVGPLPQ